MSQAPGSLAIAIGDAIVDQLLVVTIDIERDRHWLLADVQIKPAMLAREGRDQRAAALSAALLLLIANPEVIVSTGLVTVKVYVNETAIRLPRERHHLRRFQQRLDLGLLARLERDRLYFGLGS